MGVPVPVKVPVPPAPVIVTVVLPPLHKIAPAVAEAVTGAGSAMVIEAVAAHPLTSLTV